LGLGDQTSPLVTRRVPASAAAAATPGTVFLPAAATGLPRDSVADVTAVVTLNQDDLGDAKRSTPDYLLNDVDQGLRRVLDL
jgi:mRNA interferase MazF